MSIELSSRREGASAAVVAVRGEIDNETAPELRAALTAAFGNGVDRLVVDLTETAFLDSSALGALVGANKEHASGGKLLVLCPNPQLRKVFEISRLDEVFPVFDDLSSALSS